MYLKLLILFFAILNLEIYNATESAPTTSPQAFNSDPARIDGEVDTNPAFLAGPLTSEAGGVTNNNSPSLRQKFIDEANAHVRAAEASTDHLKKTVLHQKATESFSNALKNSSDIADRRALAIKIAENYKLAAEALLKAIGKPDSRISSLFKKSAELYGVCLQKAESATMYERAGDTTVSATYFRICYQKASLMFGKLNNTEAVQRIEEKSKKFNAPRMIAGEAEIVRDTYNKILEEFPKENSPRTIRTAERCKAVIGWCKTMVNYASEPMMKQAFLEKAAALSIEAAGFFEKSSERSLRDMTADFFKEGAAYYEGSNQKQKAADAYFNAAAASPKALLRRDCLDKAAALYEQLGNLEKKREMQHIKTKVDEWITRHPGVEYVV